MTAKRLAIALSLLLLGLAACGGQTEDTAAGEEPPAAGQPAPAQLAEPEPLDVAKLKERLDAGEDLVLLDVRSAEELEEHGMIEGAVNIPIDDLEARLAEVPEGKPIVTYCMRGGRAGRAAEILREHGYDQPIEYGGITEWKEAGNPVVQPKGD